MTSDLPWPAGLASVPLLPTEPCTPAQPSAPEAPPTASPLSPGSPPEQPPLSRGASPTLGVCHVPLLGELCQPFKKNLMKTGVGGLINHRSLQGPGVSGWPGGLASSTDVALKGEAALSWAAGPSASSGSTSTSTRPAGCVSSGGDSANGSAWGAAESRAPRAAPCPRAHSSAVPCSPRGTSP